MAIFNVFIPASQAQVTVSPGQNVETIVNANPAGTTFVFQPGTYRMQNIQPKNGDIFLGNGAAVLSGAELLTSFGKSGKLYTVTGQTQQGQLNGNCDSAHPQCMYPEDLYFDNVPLFHAGSVSAVVPASWYFDYATHTIYFADNPTGHVVETSVTRSAFSGQATNVTVNGFIVEKYAIPAQFGAIGDQNPGTSWTITNNEVRLNHGTGINLGPGSSATFNYIHHNGQKGVGAVGANMLVQGNSVSFNNWAGFDPNWEAGGMKFSATSNLVIRGNTVHDNVGPGVWNDNCSVNTLYENNVIMYNTGGPGIQYEISSTATIRNNSVGFNSQPQNSWLWGAQIIIQNSQSVQVYQNTVDVPAINGNGISMIQQNRGSCSFGALMTINNSVHNNTVTFRGLGQGASGAVGDYDEPNELATSSNNLFDYNAYHMADPTGVHFLWGPAFLSFAGIQGAGQEPHGTADSVMPPLM